MTTMNRNPKTHRTPLFLTAALGLALAGFAGTARADPVDLSVIDRGTGRPLQVWRHDGRLFVAGQTGAGYCLRVTNNTSRRALVVLSVDGVNIYTGQTAGVGQGGYIYDPHETYDQCGWRKSLNQIAAFSFAPLPESYAARTGRPAEVGVIGMAVFYERVASPPAATLPARPSYRAAPRDIASSPPMVQQREVVPAPEPGPPPPPPIQVKPANKAIAPPPPRVVVAPPPQSSVPSDLPEALAARTEKLGTAHGALEDSAIRLVNFERATSAPAFVRQIEYDTRENLVAAGVIPPPDHRPQAFPTRPGGGFVPDPPSQY